jgi:hypothetical protein
MQYARTPFQLLAEFHTKCFASVAFTNKQSLSLTQIMQLYVAVYQTPGIWQECWTHILPVMNAQLVRDLESFRTHNPQMDTPAFVYALQNLT